MANEGEEAIGRRAPSVGREPELDLVSTFLEPTAPTGSLLLTGGPGVGKTTLWEAGIDEARRQGFRVLLGRPSDAEARFSFSALADLLDGLDAETLEALPAPQQRALEIALLHAEPSGPPPEAGAIALGLLNVVRALAGRGPLVVAVDDVQWLDRESADALAFAARRLDTEPVRFLLTRRLGRRHVVERAFAPGRLRRLEVGPLSLGACRRMLFDRLGLTFPRRTMRRVFESAQGNPLFVLEIGRSLARGEAPKAGEIPLPEEIDDLVGARVERLDRRVRRVLLAVALSGPLSVTHLDAVAQPGALDEALDDGILVLEGDDVRASHPLIAAAVRRRSRAAERRALHLALADVVSDAQGRARHLALATRHPDTGLATLVATAAAGAAARGAPAGAVELAEHALRLTPAGSGERTDRLLALAEYLSVMGEPKRVTDLLASEVDGFPPGSSRARAHLLLAEGAVSNVGEYADHVERALAEANRDPLVRGRAVAAATEYAVARVEGFGEAEARAEAALPAARRAGPQAESFVLFGLAWARALRGSPIADLRDRFRSVSHPAAELYWSLERVAGVGSAWRGEVRDARELFVRLLALADERGEAWSYGVLRLQLCELELRAGEIAAATRLLDEWDQSSEGAMFGPSLERCRALLAAVRGDPEEAERRAAAAIAGAEANGLRWDALEALRARGIAALLVHEARRAADSLGAVWRHTRDEGVGEPGAFPVAPDLVEALVALGELEEALAVIDRVRRLVEHRDHPWGDATVMRCDALVRLASRAFEERAATDLADAADAFGNLGLRSDRARTLLSLGRSQRRHRKWGTASTSLEGAAAAFDEIGADGWAALARTELDRVGARRPAAAGELTPAERRAADLAAQGRSNKEIARALSVSVHTVEVHLSHAYSKLGVRSRGQLANRLRGEA